MASSSRLIAGISCFYHDAAVCLLRQGSVVAAAQEERFSRLKHDWKFPLESLRFCLREAGAEAGDLDLVVFYEKPLLKLERVLDTFLNVSPRGVRSFARVIPSWLHQKLRLQGILKEQTGFEGTLLFAEHHLSHGASAFFASPFDEAAVLTIDGVGEWATAAFGFGRGNRLSLTSELRFPHSLGLLYSAFTAYLGFEVNEGEYKVMGLASYGSPRYRDLLLDRVVRIGEDGSVTLDMRYFDFHRGARMWGKGLASLLPVPPRISESELKEEHFDLAATIQSITEEAVLRMARHVRRETGMRRVCMAGGVALNSAANGLILREGIFDEIFIQPAAGDAGGAVGAAYLGWHHHAGREERAPLHDVYLGPAFTSDQIAEALAEKVELLRWERLPEGDLLLSAVELLAEGKVIGWFQGRMEFGPRALGNRSILADPRRPEMKEIVNSKIKFRESFRPFAPSVPLEDARPLFSLDRESPYMLFTVPVISPLIPAVTHSDGSARVQTVRRETNPLFYDLLRLYGEMAGVPVLLNTSFNLRGEPIVCTPHDAVRTFLACGMDALVIGDFRVVKR